MSSRVLLAFGLMALAITTGAPHGGATEMAPLLQAKQSLSAAKAIAPLERAYPQFRGLTVRAITTTYSTFQRPIPRPVFQPSYACGTREGEYTYTYDWSEETPPNCTDTGAFFRRYTIPSRAAAEAIIKLPEAYAGSISLPTEGDPAASGYIYIEGWPGIGSSNSEGGLHYNAGSQRYTPYLASPGKPENDADWNVLPGSTVFLRVGSDEDPSHHATVPARDRGASCKTGCIYLTVAVLSGPNCPEGTVCIDRQFELSHGWAGNCCIFGMMTTIARTLQFTFNGGYKFGAINWTEPYTETEYVASHYKYDGCTARSALPQAPMPAPTASPAGVPCQSAGFSKGGTQLYPNSPSFIEQSAISETSENITIRNP